MKHHEITTLLDKFLDLLPQTMIKLSYRMPESKDLNQQLHALFVRLNHSD